MSDRSNDPRRRRRAGGREEDGSEGPKLTRARKVRSEFGTRVARKVTCSACGAEDTIHFAPKDDERALCRRCAADRLGVIDVEANIGPERRERCDRCGLFVVRVCTFEDPLDCKEHARALSLRQKDRARSAERSANGVLRVRRAKPEPPPSE